MTRRKHHKVATLPPEIVAAVNGRLADGHTYTDIADWLTQMGHPVGKSSVGRYAKGWSSVAEQVREAQKQAEILVAELRERPNSDLAEATEQMILTNVSNAIAAGQIDITEGDPVKIGNMIANLQRAGLQREKLKLDFRKEFEQRAAQAAAKVENIVKKGGLSAEAVQTIRSEILGVAG